MTSTARWYGMLGNLTVETEIPIPDLPPVRARGAAGGRPADLEIVTGRLPAIASPLQIDPDGTLTLTVDGVARFRAEGGRRIVVEPDPRNAAEAHIRTYLLGTVLGTVFHQRGTLPLHASTVLVGNRAVAVTGASGAGKSTLAHALLRAGCALIADDVTPVSFDRDGGPVAWPLLPQLKLWRDALERASLPADGLETIARRYDKFRLPAVGAFAEAPAPLAAVLTLDDGPAPALVRLTALQGVATVIRQTYRPVIGRTIRGADVILREAGRLVGATAVLRLERPRDATRIDDLARLVVEAVQAGPEWTVAGRAASALA
ncbi:MAG: hypothetical protein ACK4QW_01660 [Alphaproteobacteria bacterium]